MSPVIAYVIALVGPMFLGALAGIVGAFALGPKSAVVRGILLFGAGFGSAVFMIPMRRHNAISSSVYEIATVSNTLLVTFSAFMARVIVWHVALDAWDALWFVISLVIVFGGISKGRKLTYDETLDA